MSRKKLALTWTAIFILIIAGLVWDSYLYEPFRWRDTALIAFGIVIWFESYYAEYLGYQIMWYRQTFFKLYRDEQPEKYRRKTAQSRMIGTIFLVAGVAMKIYGYQLASYPYDHDHPFGYR